MVARIVVPVDGSDRCLAALGPARALAEQLGVPLRVLSVVAEGKEDTVRRNEVNAAMHRLGLDAAEVQVVSADSPAHRILLETQTEEGILVCMTSHARGALTELVLGSVSSEILRRAHRPLVITGPRLSVHWHGPVRSLVVCLDSSTQAEVALNHALDLGRQLGASIHLLHASLEHIHGGPETGEDGSDWLTGSDWHTGAFGEVPSVASAEEDPYWERLRQRAEQIRAESGLETEWQVVYRPNAPTAVTDYADTVPGAMVVTGTHGRSSLERLVLGSFATALIRGAGCPVMVVSS
ncbi:universal stress protein [Aquisalimonas sp.]|uniref:universal stress protein n=1 Tax=Aquisalimonas sp. TaxID=1872621 RepID=UPI0025C21A51|nr:universal stress protein [Aquisalimonas sp.]